MPPLRVAVVGTGAFGRNHLRVYRELEQADPGLVQLVALVEPDSARRSSFAATYNIPAFASVADLLATGLSLQAASVCVPTIHHASVAEQLLLANLDVLIEKPFAATLAEADHLINLSIARDRILAVGHLERFNPAVTATLAALNQPMFFEAHRLSIFTPRSLDVDVVLDLMIHDLDIVLSLTNSPVKEVRAVGLPILSPKTDIANVRVEFASGCVANFTASRVSTEQVRKLRLFQPHQYLSLDFARQELLSISVDPALIAAAAHPTTPPMPGAPTTQPTPSTPTGQPLAGFPIRADSSTVGTGGVSNPSRAPSPASETWDQTPTTPQHPTVGCPIRADSSTVGTGGVSNPSRAPSPASATWDGSSATPQHPTAGLSLTKADIPKGEPLRLELEDFLKAVRTRTPPRVPAEAGRAALALALTINDQIATHAHRAGLL